MTPQHKHARVVRVVVVSPGDVAAEREALRAVVDELNHDVAPAHGCVVSLWRWESDARPGLHIEGPQGVIDVAMNIAEADVVVGIFWKRFGTPTKEAESGTEHELRRAWAAWKEDGHPDVMIYFCEREHTPRSIGELEQWRRVLEFRAALLPEQLPWKYVDVAEFERQVRGHLTKVLSGVSAHPRARPAQPESAGGGDLLSGAAAVQALSEAGLAKFRQDVREDAIEFGDPSLPPQDLLAQLGLLVDGALTRAAVLLFGAEPQRELPGAVVQCVQYLGSDRTADRHSRALIDGNLRDQMDAALAFIRDRVPRREHPAVGGTSAQIDYAYPMTCLREIVVNALVHRDYRDARRHVHVRVYSDRVEVLSPGTWYADVALDGNVPLRRLESQSVKRNPLLARTMSLIRYFEGEGSGVPTAVRDARKIGAPEPVVRIENGFVIVTIFPLVRTVRSILKELVGITRFRVAAGAVALALVGLGATAASRPSAPPPAAIYIGALSQLRGKGGCIASAAATPVTDPHCASDPGLFAARSVALSPDGKNAYVAAPKSNAVAVLARDPDTGQLRRQDAVQGCDAKTPCDLDEFRRPRSVIVSPDGRHVYVGASDGLRLAVFARGARGALKQVSGGMRCLSAACPGGHGSQQADALAISPDGRSVYVASRQSGAVAILRRDARSGALTQHRDLSGCVSQGGAGGCQAGHALAGAASVTVSPDGRSVYVAADASDALTVFSRDTTSGNLTQRRGCFAYGHAAGCTQTAVLDRAESVAVSSDGANVYVASAGSDAVVVFVRDSNGDLKRKPGVQGCISTRGASDGCTGGLKLIGPSAIAVGSNGRDVYVTSPDYIAVSSGKSAAIVDLDRDPEQGTLQARPAPHGCIAESPRLPGCDSGRALGGAGSIVMTRDGANLYVASSESSAVAAFDRR